MLYEVVINGQHLGHMERADIERRAAAWRSAGVQAEILDPVSRRSVSLTDFLARPPQTVPSAPAGLIDQFDSNIPQGHYEVCVNGQRIGTLPAPDVLRRAPIWSNASVEISSPVTGALSLDAWRHHIATRFDPLLWPASGDARGYSVHVRGQSAPHRASRSEIEWQAANGVLDPGAEIADDQGASTSLHDFLAGGSPARQPAPAPSPGPTASPAFGPSPRRPYSPPAVAPFGPGPYYVRIGTSTLGQLGRDDIERRAASWRSGPVEVADSAAGPYVPLADFLRMPAAPLPQQAQGAPSWQAASGAKLAGYTPPVSTVPAVQGKPLHPLLVMGLTLITCNIFWLFWLFRSYKLIRRINPRATTITPAAAVGFLFIPVFNSFWFIRIAIDLPRSAARAVGARPGAATTFATLMFLAGTLWIFGFSFPMPYLVLWIAAFELLILGFIGYCQSALNQAFPSAGARPAKVLYSAAGAAALCGVVALFFAFVHKDAPAVMQAARDALQNGEFEAAAKQLDGIDMPEAKFDLACLYKNGLGVQPDSQKAVALMTDAANSGAPLAQTMLGLWYANGDGVTADPAQAVIWYQKAAPKDSNATVLLAMAYVAGTGVEESPAKAYEWFSVADKQGNSYATEQKQAMSGLLEEPERDAAERAAQADYAAFGGGGK